MNREDILWLADEEPADCEATVRGEGGKSEKCKRPADCVPLGGPGEGVMVATRSRELLQPKAGRRGCQGLAASSAGETDGAVEGFQRWGNRSTSC